MAVFKITQDGVALRGGATREAGLNKLDNLTSQNAKTLLEGLRTNLRGADGNAKHGVLKLRHSSKEGSQMEFARMRGMDRWFSKASTFQNTAVALEKLLVQAGAKPETAQALTRQYCASDGSIKCKDAIQLINRLIPQPTEGATMAECLQKAGIQAPPEAMQDKIHLSEEQNLEQGSNGKVFQATDHGAPCILKRLQEPIEIPLDKSGRIVRGAEMDANYLAAAMVPGTIAPNRYLIAKTSPDGVQTFHTVTAGRNFKEFCQQNKGSLPKLDDRGKPTLDDEGKPVLRSNLRLHGIIMDKAKGARMDQVRSSASDQEDIARGFAAILLNASSRGIVFYDIKRENAFVDGGKLTLIDTDGAFKNSKTEAKNPDRPTAKFTFLVPAKDHKSNKSPHLGLQQDLWSVGFTLLEHAGRGEGNLMEAGQLGDRDRYKFWLDLQTTEKRFAWLKEKIEGPEPQAGSVEDFAFLCIQTALAEPNAYFKRFTGEAGDKHLLDPILEHPLIGGREAFIERHLAKKDPLQAPAVANQTLPPQKPVPIEEIDSIDLEEEIPIEDDHKSFKSSVKEENEIDDDLSSKDPDDQNDFMTNLLLQQLNLQQLKKNTDENEN